jgi:LysM repeat protein
MFSLDKTRCILQTAELCAVVLLASCQNIPQSQQKSPLAPEKLPLTPYLSPTASPIIKSSTINPIVTSTPAPSPTPTPLKHIIVEGDTMLALAFRYGIGLEELLNANPEVNPSLMVVGTELIVPFSETNLPIFATPTPLALAVEPARCYRDVQGGAWCFILITNNHTKSIENVTARIYLTGLRGELIAEGEAIPPLNIIPAGKALPLTVYFPGIINEDVSAKVEVTSALPVPRTDERYLNSTVDVEDVAITPEGKIASVVGKVSLPLRSEPAGIIWLAAVAYDANDQVVALRKLELNRSLDPGMSLPFEIDLYSLGSPIERVEVLVEARK